MTTFAKKIKEGDEEFYVVTGAKVREPRMPPVLHSQKFCATRNGSLKACAATTS